MAMAMWPCLLALAATTASAPSSSEQTLRIEQWGDNSIRVRASPAGRTIAEDAAGALTSSPLGASGSAESDPSTTGAVSGALNCTLGDDNILRFFRGDELLLSESSPRKFGDTKYPGISNLTIAFTLASDEKIWGLGQVITDSLDASGQGCYQTAPNNGHIVIPLAHSSRGVSFFLNLPSFGTVCVDDVGATNRQFRWFSRGAANFDLWVTAAPPTTPALPAALEAYVAATGKPTPFPYWTTGFWQSKNRYRSTWEVLEIAQRYKDLEIPLAMMVIDEGAWDLLGNEGWGGCSNGSVTMNGTACPCFADAKSMTAELKAMGVECMLSPYLQFAVQQSDQYETGKAAEAFAIGVKGASDAGEPACVGYSGYNQKNADDYRCLNSTGGRMFDPYCGDGCMWDVFDNASGAIMMKNLVHTFYEKSDIKYWWLDCDEPCDYTGRVGGGDRILWGKGKWPDVAVGAQYPAALNQQIYQHMKYVEKEEHVVTLARSAWAGSQRWGTAVWSGDTAATWESLRNQVTEGQSAGLSGISYWSHDIGGYQGLNVDNSRGWDIDLLNRWFQLGAFTGIFRVHGYRAPTIDDTLPCSSDTSYSDGVGLSPTSGHNEVYTFTSADTASFNYSASIIKTVKLRESMRSYVFELFNNYSATGAPVMRPMFYEFPNDPVCATDTAGDQFMFGPDVLVAPITTNCTADPDLSCTSRHVYLPPLPAGEVWTSVYTNKTASPASGNISVSGPRDTFPLFVRSHHAEDQVGMIFSGEMSPLPGYHAL